MSGKKTAKKTAMPAKRAQPNNRGALYAGGVPGNAGGGRTPSAIRAAAREQLDKRLPLLGTFAGNPKVKTGERIRAIEALAKIGLEESIAVADVRKALDATGELIRARLAPAVADALIDEIRSIWLKL